MWPSCRKCCHANQQNRATSNQFTAVRKYFATQSKGVDESRGAASEPRESVGWRQSKWRNRRRSGDIAGRRTRRHRGSSGRARGKSRESAHLRRPQREDEFVAAGRKGCGAGGLPIHTVWRCARRTPAEFYRGRFAGTGKNIVRRILRSSAKI